jgi:hypothetical protein
MALVTLGTIFLVILAMVLIAAVPAWPHSRGWGYGPSGIIGFLILVFVFLLLTGRVSF